MSKLVHFCTVDSNAYYVDVDTGEYYSLQRNKKKSKQRGAWLAGIGSATIFCASIVARPIVSDFDRWYYSVSSGAINLLVLLVGCVVSALIGFFLARFLMSKFWYVPVVLDRELEVKAIKQARKQMGRILRYLISYASVVVVVGVLFYCMPFFVSIVFFAYLFMFLLFFILPYSVVAKFKFIWKKWRGLKREGVWGRADEEGGVAV